MCGLSVYCLADYEAIEVRFFVDWPAVPHGFTIAELVLCIKLYGTNPTGIHLGLNSMASACIMLFKYY